MILLIPFVTNGFSHPYHLDEFIFTFRDIRNIFSFYFIFDENNVSKQNNPRCDAAFLRRHIWGYSVCLCPIKRTRGLHGLMLCNNCEHKKKQKQVYIDKELEQTEPKLHPQS